jgi:uncharacterized protein YbjT (DUF2867 family)
MGDGTKVLVVGASGFIGTELVTRLVAAGIGLRCGTRDVARSRARRPSLKWVALDLTRRETIGPALEGCSSAVYLVHEMAGGSGYERREREDARAFAAEAAARGIERIVYLGGVAPQGEPSRHLQSRLATGAVLRAGEVPVFELRAAMVVGAGSASFQIVRDLAARLPVMILPRWLASRSQPIAVDDVTFALERSLELPLERAGIYDLPGPEVLSAREILLRIAALRGTKPTIVDVPVLTPRLSSYWLRLVSGADYQVARQLVLGLSHDILASQPELWPFFPEHVRVTFDEAARRALQRENERKHPRAARFEAAVARVSRASH